MSDPVLKQIAPKNVLKAKTNEFTRLSDYKRVVGFRFRTVSLSAT